MYKTLFWIAIVSWIVLVGAIIKSGGGFVWRVEELEARTDEISQRQTDLSSIIIGLYSHPIWREFEDLKFMNEVTRTQLNQLRP